MSFYKKKNWLRQKNILIFLMLPIFFAFQHSSKTNLNSINIEKLHHQKTQYDKENNHIKAIEILIQISEYYKEKEEWNDYVKTNIEIAFNYGFLNDSLKVKYAKTAIRGIKIYKIEDDLLLANALLTHADAVNKTGKIKGVIEEFNQAAKIFKKYESWHKVIDCLFGIAEIQYRKGEFINAKFSINQALGVVNISQEKKYETNLLNLLSVIHYLEGDFQSAISTTLLIVKLIEENLDNKELDKRSLADFYKNLGAYYTRKGEYENALNCYNRISQLYNFDKTATLKLFPRHFENISKIEYKKGSYRSAIKAVKNSINYYENLPNYTERNQKLQIINYNTIASSFFKLGIYDSVSYYVNKAIEIPIPFNKHYTYLRLAGVNFEEGEFEKALMNLELSQVQYQTNKREDLFYLIYLNHDFAKLERSKKNYNQALSHTHKILAIIHSSELDTIDIYTKPSLKNIKIPTEFLLALQAKAQLFTLKSNSLKDQQAALETYQLATQWIDSLQQSYVLEGSQLFWSNKFKEVYEEAITLNHQFYQKTGESKYLKTAFDLTEKSKALLLLEGLKDNAGQATASLPDSLTQKEKDLKIAVAFYEKSLQTATEKKQEDRIQLYQSYLADNRLELARLKEQMEADYPTYYALKYANTNISIEEMQANMLTNHQVFINYFLGKQKSYAFVIGKDFSEFIELAPIDTIQPKGQAFLQLLKNPSLFQQNAKLAFQNYNQSAFDLYQLVFQQIDTKIPSSTNQLIISPDGILNQVPFAALTTELLPQPSMDFGQLPYLLHRYPIHYAYSANLLWNNRQKKQQRPANSQLLAYAPSYQSNGQIAELRGGSADLVGTKTEIQAIAKYFEGDFQNNEFATKNHFQANAVNYGLLHLAMHGEGNSKTGSHLIFTDQNQPEKTAHFLHDYEISNMDLTAQLAVLSACETGVGEYVDGEGVFSLARSFMYAGVPSIAMSLWQVNDLTTSQIMPEFYKNLADGSSKAISLHQAKQSFLANADLEYRHPYYWSGFVLLGDGQALKMEGLSTGLLWGIGLTCILIGAWGYFQSKNHKSEILHHI